MCVCLSSDIVVPRPFFFCEGILTPQSKYRSMQNSVNVTHCAFFAFFFKSFHYLHNKSFLCSSPLLKSLSPVLHFPMKLLELFFLLSKAQDFQSWGGVRRVIVLLAALPVLGTKISYHDRSLFQNNGND